MNNQELQKIAQFVKEAMAEIASLREELENTKNANLQKSAADASRLDNSVRKAANALYDSDYINDEYAKDNFVKKSKEDPAYMAKIIEKLCHAADVGYMGKVSGVKSVGEVDDPVMRKAFGYLSNSYNLIDEE